MPQKTLYFLFCFHQQQTSNLAFDFFLIISLLLSESNARPIVLLGAVKAQILTFEKVFMLRETKWLAGCWWLCVTLTSG